MTDLSIHFFLKLANSDLLVFDIKWQIFSYINLERMKNTTLGMAVS